MQTVIIGVFPTLDGGTTKRLADCLKDPATRMTAGIGRSGMRIGMLAAAYCSSRATLVAAKIMGPMPEPAVKYHGFAVANVELNFFG
jgi:hypothetical protein